MNSLSIISSTVDKVIGNTPPSSPPADALDELRHSARPVRLDDPSRVGQESNVRGSHKLVSDSFAVEDESEDEQKDARTSQVRMTIGHRLYTVFLGPWVGAFRWIISAVTLSFSWALSPIFDDRGMFAPLEPFRRIRNYRHHHTNAYNDSYPALQSSPRIELTSEDGEPHVLSPGGTDMRRTRSRVGEDTSGGQEIIPRRSIRIRLYNDEKSGKGRSSVSAVKSPTSPSTSLRLTKYPRAMGPPTPLLPRRPAPKTLILDLDETLIHSLAKGGRMSSGHMVEVKLDRQHAILYYVHKRPYCDEFLRKVCRWYNLVIFTASVQEYADPVIDWLEQDRKYFSGRYYRQHCTNRNGAYIKDIATVEPDLSKVMIIDNSPTSYIFHEDNAIPIEGWINDPTDLDLLHLIPMLQALRYATDVRALLALRMGESLS
ncbi:hypothetical protein EX30DRAFT_332350 [Ascodesmis nigricans]|uniref:FCP1 homology domain-containing protein n=1 Tax=Ascodesmis nigricans TaxID=341454 RepID=A0A4S2MV10_9PEZI|nr:hypothetical protein EX30DRAFT_332350 [Ascodesmis nigricans]